jgi:hypothetical protein
MYFIARRGKMNIPGFTAEASLGKTRDRYILASGTSVDAGGVLPQFYRRFGNYIEIIYPDGMGGYWVHWVQAGIPYQ